jgi:lysophospholipase L1-like esterase
MSDRGRRVARRTLFFALALALSVVAAELILRLAAAAIPEVDAMLGAGTSPTVPDVVLGHRPAPQASDSDATGFRNPKRPRSATVVAIGDSQTYGTGVTRQDSWPHVLGNEHGIPTYSMAYGGYGVTHYLVLAREALDQLDPEVIVIAIYAGNDLLDSWRMVYERGQLQELLPDGADPLGATGGQLDEPLPQSEWLRLREATEGTDRGIGRLRSILARHTRLYGLARAVKRTAARSFASGAGLKRADPDPEVVRATVAEADAGMFLPVQVGLVTTVLTPAAREAVVDLADPRIREGLRLSLEAIRRLHLEASGDGARVVVLMIPTKEHVFAPWVDPGSGAAADVVQQLVDHEARMWGELTALCDDLALECVSALGGLRSTLEDGSNPYFSDWDGHPSRLGHRVIAGTVAASATIRDLPDGY